MTQKSETFNQLVLIQLGCLANGIGSSNQLLWILGYLKNKLVPLFFFFFLMPQLVTLWWAADGGSFFFWVNWRCHYHVGDVCSWLLSPGGTSYKKHKECTSWNKPPETRTHKHRWCPPVTSIDPDIHPDDGWVAFVGLLLIVVSPILVPIRTLLDLIDVGLD